MLARDQAVRLVEVLAQLLGGARLAGVVAGGRQPAAQRTAACLEAAHVIALPAVQADRDRGELRQRRVGVHAQRRIPFARQRVGVTDLFLRKLRGHQWSSFRDLQPGIRLRGDLPSAICYLPFAISRNCRAASPPR